MYLIFDASLGGRREWTRSLLTAAGNCRSARLSAQSPVARVDLVLGGGSQELATRCRRRLAAGDVWSLIAFVLLPRQAEVAGMVAEGVREEPGAGQSQAGAAAGEGRGAVCGIADEDDATAVPGRHLDLTLGVEVQMRVLHGGVDQFRDSPLGVTGKGIDEDAVLRREVVVVGSGT